MPTGGLRNWHLTLIVEQLDLRSLEIDKCSRPRDGGADVAAAFVLDRKWPQLRPDALVIEVGRDLKRDAPASVRRAGFEPDHFLTDTAAEKRLSRGLRQNVEADDVRIVFDLPREIRRFKHSVADTHNADHGLLHAEGGQSR